MTDEQLMKVKAVEDYLSKKKISFFRFFRSKKYGVTSQVYIPLYRILVKVSKGKDHDDEFYTKVKYAYHPIFIREGDSVEFTIEKLENCIETSIKLKPKRKRKRVRIKHFEKVEPKRRTYEES